MATTLKINMHITNLLQKWRIALYDNFTVTTLKTIIVLWAIFVIFLVIFVINDPWILAGIFLYEALP